MHRLVVVIVGTALALSPVFARAQDTARADGFAFPGGVADASGETAYVDAATGGVEAIILASGGVRWHAPTLARPLGVVRDRLVTLAPTVKHNDLRVVIVETTTGKLVRTSVPFSLPAWVSIPPSYAHTFDCTARVEHERVIVWWHATATWSQGMHPSEGQEDAARHEGSGAVEFVLDSGRARAVIMAPPTPTPTASLPPELAERYKAEQRAETLDGHHLLVRNVAGWLVLELPSGRRKGEVHSDERPRAPVVIGPRLFHERLRPRRQVEAIDLKNGAVQWEHALATPPAFPSRP